MRLNRPLFKQAVARLVESALRNVEYFQRRLFAPIIFENHWPTSLRRYFQYYWYFPLLYALPFFFAFMLLRNSASEVWAGSTLATIFLMNLLLDWITLTVHCLLGSALAVLAFVLTSNVSVALLQHYEYLAISLFAVLIGAISNYYSQRIRIKQERAMLLTTSNIAHELRTPLLRIRAGATGVANYLPTLLQIYQLAHQHQLPVSSIRNVHLQVLEGIIDHIDNEERYANAIIDMLSVNARIHESDDQALSSCSMVKCVDMALQRYPFSSQERTFISWQPDSDFAFQGVGLLTVHLLFNLLKNALHHIAQAGKGSIWIDIETTPNANRLSFTDTGGGLHPAALAHIFTRFYTCSTDSMLGAGIGLAFCRDVMHTFADEIDCNSTHGEYCEFVLTFPAV